MNYELAECDPAKSNLREFRASHAQDLCLVIAATRVPGVPSRPGTHLLKARLPQKRRYARCDPGVPSL